MKILPPTQYFNRNVGGRALQVSSVADRKAHQALLEEIRHIEPLSFKPDQIQADIRQYFKIHPQGAAVRTDVQKCFPSIAKELVDKRLDELALTPEQRQSLKNVYATSPKGMPTGSPLSPWLADLVLKQVDRAMAGTPYFRYADDICILGADNSECQVALAKLKGEMAKLGLTPNPDKTKITNQKDLSFIGRTFNEQADQLLFTVNLGGKTFNLPNGKNVFMSVTEDWGTTPKGSNLTYTVNGLLAKMGKDPGPYIFELLMLKPTQKNVDLQKIIDCPESIIDTHTPYVLHHKIYTQYKNLVKPQVEADKDIPIGEAGEVYRWLYLTNHIMTTGKVPSNYAAIEEEWQTILPALEADDFAPYHKKIKELFKLEYRLKLAPPAKLPATKSAIELSIE
jgi:hypothetical protein